MCGIRVQKRGKDSRKYSLFLEEIRISDLLASVASRAVSHCRQCCVKRASEHGGQCTEEAADL